MKKLFNYLAFNAVWYAAVEGAARGMPWAGPAALTVLLAVHLGLVPRAELGREARLLLVTGIAGTLADSALQALGLLRYPTSPPSVLVPVWISSLWVAFATLPRFSLAWLVPRPVLAALLGALVGPLSFELGRRIGAIDAGGDPVDTCIALALEYALATPLLLRGARHAA